jgi:hypothetical protein
MEEGINNYEASTLVTLSSEYITILEISLKFSNLHRMRGKYILLKQICNQ